MRSGQWQQHASGAGDCGIEEMTQEQGINSRPTDHQDLKNKDWAVMPHHTWFSRGLACPFEIHFQNAT